MAKRRVKMPREVTAARNEITKGVAHLGRSVTDVQMALRRAERQIEADARKRIGDLRKDAKAQLAVLATRRRQARRMLGRLSTAAGGSWRDVKRGADQALSDARTVAESVMARFRRAVRA